MTDNYGCNKQFISHILKMKSCVPFSFVVNHELPKRVDICRMELISWFGKFNVLLRESPTQIIEGQYTCDLLFL